MPRGGGGGGRVRLRGKKKVGHQIPPLPFTPVSLKIILTTGKPVTPFIKKFLPLSQRKNLKATKELKRSLYHCGQQKSESATKKEEAIFINRTLQYAKVPQLQIF